MAQGPLGNIYSNVLADREKRQRLTAPSRDWQVKAAEEKAARSLANVKKLTLERKQEHDYAVTKYELQEKGILSTVKHNALNDWHTAVGSTKHIGAQAAASHDVLEAGEVNQMPENVIAAYNNLTKFRDGAYKNILPDIKMIEERIAAGKEQMGDQKALAYLKAQYQKALPNPEDIKLLNSKAYNTVKDWRTQSETHIPIGDETFLQRLHKSELAQRQAIEKVGDPEAGKADMFNSQAKINPYHQQQRANEIQKMRERVGINEARRNAGNSLLANALVDAVDFVGVTTEGLSNPAALVQDLAQLAPYMVGGGYTAVGGAALQAVVEDHARSQQKFTERTGKTFGDSSERTKMAGWTAANMAANSAENLLALKAAKGGFTPAASGAVPDTVLKQALGAVARPVGSTVKAVTAATLADGGAGYIQSAIQNGLGSLEGGFDHERAVEDAALGGALAGGMAGTAATPVMAFRAIGDAGKAVSAANRKATAAQRGTAEQNLDASDSAYSPAEAIAKHASRLNDEGVDKAEIYAEATKARDIAQQNFSKIEKSYQAMTSQLDQAKTIREQVKQKRDALGESITPEQEQGLAKAEQFAESIETQYDKATRKEVAAEYKKHAEIYHQSQTAYQAFHGFTEVQSGAKQTKETVAENVAALSNPKADPETKAKATEHLRSFPMAYKPEQILKFTDDLTNDLTDAQRTTLREFAAETVKAHMNKGIKDVSADLSVGGKGYRKLNDYFTLHAQAARTNDTFEQARLAQQFQNLAESFAKKAELAKSLLKDAQEGVHFQVIRTEGGAWKVNTGKHLNDEKLRANGGFNIKAGSGALVKAIASDNEKVQKAHDLFVKMTAPEFTGTPEPVANVAPESVPTEPMDQPPETEWGGLDESSIPELDMAEPTVITDVDADNYKEVQATADKKATEARQKSFDDLKAEHVAKAKKPEPAKPKSGKKSKKQEKIEAAKEAHEDLFKDIPESKSEDTPEKRTEASTEPSTPEVDNVKAETADERAEETTETQDPADAVDVPTDHEAEGTHVFGPEPAATVPALKGSNAARRKVEKAKDYFARNIVAAYFKQGSKDKAPTPLVATENLVETVLKGENVKEHLTKVMGTTPTEQQLQHLETFIGFHDEFSKTLDEIFIPKVDEKNSQWKHQDLVQFLTDEDNKLPANVKTALAIGAFNWLLQNGSPDTAIATDEGILKMLGLPTDQGLSVPSKIRSALAGLGIRQNVVVATMGASIAKSLQLKVDSKADPEYMGRMEASLGLLALHALEAKHFIHRTTDLSSQTFMDYAKQVLDGDSISKEGEETTDKPETETEEPEVNPDLFVKQVFVRVNHAINKGRLEDPEERVQEFMRSNKGTKGFLNDVLGADDPMRRPLLKKPEGFVQRAIKKSKLFVPSKTAENSAKAEQEGYSAREPVVKLFKVLHSNAELQLKKMLGIDDSEANLNTFHKDRRENQKAKFKNEWNSLSNALEYMDELNDKRVDGKLPEFYMPISVWSNQRLGYTPNMFNIQTSQIHRAMAGMTAHRTEINLRRVTDDYGNHVGFSYDIYDANGKLTEYGTWLKALALGAEEISDAKDATGKAKLDLTGDYKGGKTADKADGQYFLPRFQDYLNREDVQANIDAMVRVLAATDMDKVPDPKDVDLVAAQVAEFGMGAHSLLVLTELAQFKSAVSKGENHVTSIGIESDGVTNGPAIANTLAGTLTQALAMQFGLVPMAEGGAIQHIKNYLDIKSEGTADYYQTFGKLQLEFINRILGNAENTVRGRLAGSMARLAGGFGDRGSAKKWATPFNYSAGYPALKAALARELEANILKTYEKIAKKAQTDHEAAERMYADFIRDVNVALDYHNKHMQVMPDATPDTVLKMLPRIEAEYKMLNPMAELPPRPTHGGDKVAMANYLNAISNAPFTFTADKVSLKSFSKSINFVIANHNKKLPRAKTQVALLFDKGQDVARATEFSMTKAQMQALRRVSVATHGLASEHAIKVAAKEYIQVRNLNTMMNNVAFDAFDVLRKSMIDKAIAEKRKAGLIPTRKVKKGGKEVEIDLEGLTRQELDKIDKDLMTYAPILVSAMGSQSDNPLEGGLFLSKMEKGFDTSDRNEVRSFAKDSEGGTNSIVSGVAKQSEVQPGVRSGAMATQAADSRISSNTVARTAATNVHDANIAGIKNYAEMSKIQNEEFFNLLVEYRSQVEQFNALLRPINGLAMAVERFKLHESVNWKALRAPLVKDLTKALKAAGLIADAEVGKIDLAEMLIRLSDAKYASEIKKIEFAKSLYSIHQYGGEGGEFVLGKKERDRLDEELESLMHDQVASHEHIRDTVAKLNANREIKELPPIDREGTPLQQGLIDYKGKEIPADVVIGLLDDALKDGDAVHRELFKLLKKILPEGLKFEYVNDNWKGQKQAAGWYNPKSNTISIRAVGSKFNYVTPELFLHEMVHASLVSLTAVKNPNPQIQAAVQRIEDLRVEMLDVMPERFAEALVNKEEFMAWGLTNPAFQDAMRGILVHKGERNRKGFRSAFSTFVRNVVSILFGDDKAPTGKQISAIEALLIDSAEIMNYVVTEQPDRSGFTGQVLPMIRNVDELIKDAKTTSVSDLAKSFDAGNVSPEFQAHLQDVVDGPVTRLFDGLGADHLDDLTTPVDYKPNEMAAVHGLTDREEYVAEMMATVVDNTQDSAAHTAVMRELTRMYEDARGRLSPKDFHDGDWATATTAEKHIATRQYNHIFRPKVTGGKSNYLANFVGLAMGSEKFNKLLDYVPKNAKVADRNMLQKIQDFINDLVDWSMNALATRSLQSGTNAVRVEKLADRLVKIDLAKRQSGLSKFDKVWTFAVDTSTMVTGKGASKVVDYIVKHDLTNTKSRTVNAVAKVTKAMAGDNSDKIGELVQAMRDDLLPNTRYGEINEIVNEIRTPSDFRHVLEAHLRESVNIQNTRKSWIDITKRSVIEAFSNKGKDLTKDQHTALTYTVLRSDLHGLTDTRKLDEVVRLFKDRTHRKAEINKLSNEIKRMSPEGNDMVNRAHDLGYYMATGDSADGLGKNALVIAQGVGTHYRTSQKADPALIKAIDDLATLYSLEHMDVRHLREAAKVIDTEMGRAKGNGFADMMKMHKFLSESAAAKFKDNPYSVSKGYMPEITHTYREMVIAPVQDAKDLEAQGYEMVDEVERDPMDVRSKPQAIFILKDGGIQRIVSGAVTFDNTHAKGSVVTDGRRGALTAEYSKELTASTRVRAKIPSDKYNPIKVNGKRLTPQYDSQGEIIDFHYEMSAAVRDKLLVRNNNFGDLMGAYAGSNATTQDTAKQNSEVVKALFDDYNTEYVKNPRAFVAIGPNSTDPRLAEIWRLLPYDVKVQAGDLWGKGNPLMIRNELVNVSFGFKKYSVAEMFDKAAKERNIAEKFFVGLIESLTGLAFQPKQKARLYAVRGERFIQEVMKLVKDIIVIRTASVLWGNIKANLLLHLAYGVNPVHAMKDTWLAVRAGLSYKKQRALIIQAEENLRAGIGDAAKWEQQIVKAQDAIARNPALEFIEAGMMPSIVEDVELSSADYTYSTDLQTRFDAQIQRVPSSLRTAGKWMMLSHDTPAYKFLAGATQYSDFTSKYVLYKHLTSGKKPKSHAEAIQEASDAFINYDVPTSRGLQYMNDMGLVMFTKFFLRFQRVMLKLMQTRPALVLGEHLATEWLSNTPGVLDPSFVNNIGVPLRPSILQAPSAVTDIVTFKTLF